MEEQKIQKVLEITQDAKQKIQKDIIAMYSDQRLIGKIRISQSNQENNQRISIQLIHPNNKTQTLVLHFGKTFPHDPPQAHLQNSNAPVFFCYSQLLSKKNWKTQSQIADLVFDIFNNLEKFHNADMAADHNLKKKNKNQDKINLTGNGNDQQLKKQVDYDKQTPQNKIEQSSEKKTGRKKTNMMNGCSDRELTQTKNLNRHFRSKLREVLKDQSQDQNHQPEYKQISQLFAPNRVGFQDIRKVLSNDWFRSMVDQQMQNGMFLNKILRGTMGMKSKKLMIKYYHVMLSAVDKPDSFQRWKYE